MTGNPESVWFFFFNDTATTEIYTLSLHDALPIHQSGNGDSAHQGLRQHGGNVAGNAACLRPCRGPQGRGQNQGAAPALPAGIARLTSCVPASTTGEEAADATRG